MKRIVVVLSVCGLLAFQACESSNQTAERSRLKTMLIKSSGEVSVIPNEARIAIQLECIDKNIKTSKNCLIEKSESLNTTILDFGVKPDDILTTSINQSKECRWINNSTVFVGYKSSITTQLTIRQLERLEDLYTNLSLNKNISIGNLSYSHSKIDSLNNAAYLKALENANNLADQLLSKMKETEKEIIRIGNMDLPSVRNDYETLYESDAEYEVNLKADKRSVNINSGIMYANQTLIVEYSIK